ncbi:CvpA family protein [Mangrovimonas sp. AS39]|uniref:CvpA family protein n=1 Tax=Mangrovimonas TaxID=1211036 RepID=UPI00141F1A64|nr:MULTISPECIES: CvpA family protein [Mangrovimonas]MCF1190480.1 CvpA family protein [Mangrovimonas futianensis]MCF1193768.1 CvpA family protein [Mangrovimonas futianensis]NIK91027.1 CvpA family protein [Mangrovimonas sp. CR14]
MSIIDIVLAALILFGIVRGFMKGLFVEIASLVALVAGVFGAIHFSYFASDLLKERFEWEENTISIVAFAITFLIIVLAIALAGKALTKLADFAALGILNRLLGAIFGGLKIALILSALLVIYGKYNDTIDLGQEEHMKDSVLYEPVRSLLPTIFPIIMDRNANAIERPIKEDENAS